jgi:hypothetical protein
MAKIFLNYFGLLLNKRDAIQNIDPTTYLSVDTEKIKIHREFLKANEAEENSRLAVIEGKTSQLVSQTGMIFSLLSLFIPIIIDKLSDKHFVICFLFMAFLAMAFILYILTIWNATKNFNVKKFSYMRPSAKNVITHQDKTPSEFSAVEVQDLLLGANHNQELNNIKATNLIHSYNSFKVANIFTALIGILICFVLLFTKQKQNTIIIENPIKIQNFDTAINIIVKEINKITTLNKTVINKADTVKSK